MALSIAPGSIVRCVRSWRCEVCGDYWIIQGSVESQPVATLIYLHQSLGHGGEFTPGKYLTWYVVDAPMRENQARVM